MAPNKVVGLLDKPPAAYEFATLLQFNTSYELIDCLAKQLQHASDMLTREHKDREMIQKSMLSIIKPEE